jgi:hypothetical protein
MMIQTQKRADKQQAPQSIADTTKVGLVLPPEVRDKSDFPYQISYLPAVSVGQPPGRAPPRLV